MAFSSKDKHGLAIIAAVVLVLLVAGGATAYFKAGPKADAQGCMPNISGRTVILLDHSEGVPVQTAREIRERILRVVREEVATYDHLSIYTVTDRSSKALEPVFQGCKPPATGNQLYQGVKSIKAKFEQGFIAKIDAALLQTYPDATMSPIAQAVADLTLSQELSGPAPRLLIFSDMLENSDALSMYQCSPGESPIQAYKAHNAGALQRPEFHNVSVSLNVIPRRGLSEATLQCRKRFWPWFFGDNDGDEAGLTQSYLPG